MLLYVVSSVVFLKKKSVYSVRVVREEGWGLGSQALLPTHSQSMSIFYR